MLKYVKPEDIFENILKLIKQNGLQDIFEVRAYEIVENATDGWGHSSLSKNSSYSPIFSRFLDFNISKKSLSYAWYRVYFLVPKFLTHYDILD